MAPEVPSNYVLTIDAKMPDGELYQFKSDAGGMPWVLCKSRRGAMPMRAAADF